MGGCRGYAEVAPALTHDENPLHFGGTPAYRSVRVQLTDEQRKALVMVDYEAIDNVFIEPMRDV